MILLDLIVNTRSSKGTFNPKILFLNDLFFQNFFRGCWDPYATGVKRQVGDTWLHEKPGVGKCCQAVCKRWGSVEFSCTNKLCNELSTDFKFEQSKDKIYARVVS